METTCKGYCSISDGGCAMKYIVALIDQVRGHTVCELDARQQSADGRVLLNESDLKCLDGTLEERVSFVKGTILNEKEAFRIINSKKWRNRS